MVLIDCAECARLRAKNEELKARLEQYAKIDALISGVINGIATREITQKLLDLRGQENECLTTKLS